MRVGLLYKEKDDNDEGINEWENYSSTRSI
jgi:hypothetical protein